MFMLLASYLHVFVLMSISLRMHRLTRLHTPTACAAASKLQEALYRHCIVQLTAVMITGHITFAGHITDYMTV